MPFPDRPLPADFEIAAIAPPKRKPKFMPSKPKGATDLIGRDLKHRILNGAAEHGYDGEGAGGLDGYLRMCAERYPKAYLHLVGKLVPLQVDNKHSGAVIGAVNVISVPTDRYLSHEDIERLRAAPQLDHEPRQPNVIEIAPQRSDDDEPPPDNAA